MQNPTQDPDYAYLNDIIANVAQVIQAVQEEAAQKAAEEAARNTNGGDDATRHDSNQVFLPTAVDSVTQHVHNRQIDLSTIPGDDVTSDATPVITVHLVSALRSAAPNESISILLGDKVTLDIASVSEIVEHQDLTITIVFRYMGYEWTVQIPDKNTLGLLLNADGSLNLLRFISLDYVSYIIRIVPLTLS